LHSDQFRKDADLFDFKVDVQKQTNSHYARDSRDSWPSPDVASSISFWSRRLAR
jgi:hypothetical protein